MWENTVTASVTWSLLLSQEVSCLNCCAGRVYSLCWDTRSWCEGFKTLIMGRKKFPFRDTQTNTHKHGHTHIHKWLYVSGFESNRSVFGILTWLSKIWNNTTGYTHTITNIVSDYLLVSLWVNCHISALTTRRKLHFVCLSILWKMMRQADCRCTSRSLGCSA